jgi:hypothetical protein
MQSEFLQIVLTSSRIAGKSEWPASRVSSDEVRTAKGHHRSPYTPAQQIKAPVSETPPPVLHQLLSVLTTSGGANWQSYDSIPGIEWCEINPQSMFGAELSAHPWSRAGRLMLPGFADVALPDRDLDGGYAIRLGNEGECSLSLFGDIKTVHEIVLVKYYPCENAASAMVDLLQGTLDVQLLEAVPDDPTQSLSQIRCPDGGIAYVAITNHEGGRSGPGFTTFVLTPIDPRARGE